MKLSKLFICGFYISVNLTNTAFSQTAPISFNNAQCFSVLAATTITNTGPTVVANDIGVSPGSSITGYNTLTGGKILDGDQYVQVGSLAGPAQTSAAALYTQLWNRTDLHTTNFTAIPTLGYADGPTILSPGIYTFSSAVLTGGTLILDDSADPNAIFIFKITSTITTATYSTIKMLSGGPGKNVFWLVGSSATIETYTNFSGNVIAYTSISIKTGAKTTGKLIALNAAVTMDNNKVTSTGCANKILPITYQSFTAACKNKFGLLNWSTATEVNNGHFTIESSADDINWHEEGIVNGAGNSEALKNYSFKSPLSINPITFYRLKQTDFSGNNSYSSTVILKNCAVSAIPSVTLYPNPSNGKFNILYSGDRSKIKLIEVFNSNGIKIKESINTQTPFDLSNQLPGLYFIRIHLDAANIIHASYVKKDI